ncbi:MAG: hypothetical protein ACOC4K_04245, partial [Verrucomicrobiota bacterium]
MKTTHPWSGYAGSDQCGESNHDFRRGKNPAELETAYVRLYTLMDDVHGATLNTGISGEFNSN